MRKVLFLHSGGGLGDLLLSSPILSAIKQTWPEAHTTCWANPRHAAVLDGHPAVDCSESGLRAFGDSLKAIRAGAFDVAVLPWTTGRDAWLAFLGGVARRVGQSGRLAYSFLFTDPVDVRSAAGDDRSHWVDIQLDYARALGCNTDGLRPVIRLHPRDHAAAAALLSSRGIGARPVAVLHIGKGVPITLTRWPIDRFVDIGRRLRDDFGCDVLLTGSAAEQLVVDEVAARIGGSAFSVAGRTPLRTLCALIARAQVVVCPDSGPMHIAAALEVPVVGIFALRTDIPTRWRPYSARARVIRAAASRCAPACVKERCPRFACLEEIDVNTVIDAVRGLMQEGLPVAGTGQGRPA